MIYLPFPIVLLFLLALGVGLVVLRLRGRAESGLPRLALRLLALILFAGALVAGGAGLLYGLLGAALQIAGAWSLAPIGLALAGGMIWAGWSLWRKTITPAAPPPAEDLR